MRCRRPFNQNGNARFDVATRDDNPHDAEFQMRAAIGIPGGNRLGQPPLISIDLLAGVPQAGQFDTGISHMKTRARREIRQPDSRSRDVFTQITGTDIKAGLAQIAEQFRLYEMNLTQVGRRSVYVLEIEMLNRHTFMGIAFDTQRFDKGYGVTDRFLEHVSGGAADRNNLT